MSIDMTIISSSDFSVIDAEYYLYKSWHFAEPAGLKTGKV